jgi:Uma2 family endonuclease
MTTSELSATSEIVRVKATRRKPLLPYKFEDRMQLPAYMRIPAPYEDFIELMIMCDYKVEYSNGDIVSILETDRKNPNIIMGNATLTHEEIVLNIAHLINLIIFRQSRYKIFGSNAKVFHTEGQPTYNPDLTVVNEKPITRKYKHRRQNQEVLTNPSIVIEILSQGTREYDLVEKFANYRKIESMEQIIFVEQYFTEVSSYTRLPNGTWSYTNLLKSSDELDIANGKILLADIYNKVDFDAAN